MQNIDNGQSRRSTEPLPSPWATPRERAMSRWEPPVAVDPSIEDQLAMARANRTQAETARQKIANEILEATRAVCQELIADGERYLDRAKYLEAMAEQKHLEAQGELEYAQSIRAEAEAYREKVMADTQQQAHEHLNRARATAERECLDLKQQASLEAQTMLAQAETMRSAAREELEAQRIYTEAARLKAESQEVLVEARGKLVEPVVLRGDNADSQGPAILEMAGWWQTVDRADPPGGEEISSEEAQPAA